MNEDGFQTDIMSLHLIGIIRVVVDSSECHLSTFVLFIEFWLTCFVVSVVSLQTLGNITSTAWNAWNSAGHSFLRILDLGAPSDSSLNLSLNSSIRYNLAL